jgi:GT2 family glycosyltransferase
MDGNGGCDVSVVISTHNRSDVLVLTIESLAAQESRGTRYEVIVVDNNSTDQTQQVVREAAARGHSHLRLLFEPRPGVSHGRNAGIRAAAAPIVAFTDDDVCVDRHWVANIKRAFDKYPDVDYITGKVLPRWEGERPAWLTPDNWGGPCVLRDRGDAPISGVPGTFFPGWATCNLAVRRRLIDRIGTFSGEFDRGEDLEFILRVWRADLRGMYVPDVIVTHRVPADRMTKAYHRGWHVAEGRIRARLRYKEIFDAEGRIRTEPLDGPRLLGTPAFLYRELFHESKRWLRARWRRQDGVSFRHECQIRQLISYMRSRKRLTGRERLGSSLSNITWFVTAMVSRKARQLVQQVEPGLPPRPVHPPRTES